MKELTALSHPDEFQGVCFTKSCTPRTCSKGFLSACLLNDHDEVKVIAPPELFPDFLDDFLFTEFV